MEDYSSKEEKFLEDKEIPDEVKEKLKNLKNNLEKFKDEVLKKYQRYVIGIALLPPNKEAKKEEKDKVSVFVLVDDSDNLKVEKDYPREKIFEAIDKIANEVNKNISPQTMMLSELKESCFDGKYEVLQLIGLSAIIYDKGMLGALKVSEIHKTMSIKKFEKYVLSYVGAGSLFRSDSNPNDIDVFIVIDDTDVKKMSRAELKDKLRAIIQSMGQEASQLAGVKASFHVQTYILTDFWDSIKDANPVIFTFLRDGVPLYDRGVFLPWKLLLKMGRIRPSPEAIDMNMDIGERLLERTKQKLLSVVGEDLYYATLNPAQAALMLYGIPPTTPKETVALMDKIFVKKEKLLERKYIDTLEKIRKYYKDVEHNKIKEISGIEIDKLLKEIEAYLKRVKVLFNEIEKRTEIKNITEMYDAVIAVTRDALYVSGLRDVNINRMDRLFREYLVDSGKMPDKFHRILRLVIKVKRDNDEKKKPSKQEIEMINKEARNYIKTLFEFIQRSRGLELERAKVRFKYGHNKYGEILLLDKVAFIIGDLEKKDDVNIANIVNGSLKNIRKSSIEEMEKELSNIKIPARAFIKEPLFEDLKKLYGNDVEVAVSY
ncbi:hypothetical protein J4409_01230 [Candidatus Woesearchaeota archaeon]|nr:hypothetical protein [Candidatus Woesearchaeota archaeon]